MSLAHCCWHRTAVCISSELFLATCKVYACTYNVTGMAASIENLPTSNCTKATETCPLTSSSWNSRAAKFNCTVRNYTCIKDQDGKLVEACIWAYELKPGMIIMRV